MEEGPELISPRISFSHDLPTVATTPPPAVLSRRSDTSLMSRLPEPEFDFPNATAAADVAPADRLFAGGVLLPMPPLPPAAPTPNNPCCKQHPTTTSTRTKPPPACQQKRSPPPGSSWASPFSRSSSVNSATTTGAPRSSSGRFGCPSFPLMRSRSAGSVAVGRDGVGSVASDGGAGRRPQHKKFGAGSNGGSSRVYYYGGGKKGGGSSHGVMVSPVINVPFIGASLVNVFSYLICDCSSSKTTKSRGI